MISVLRHIFRQGRVEKFKIKRIEIILALLAAFRQYGKKEVSLSELQIAAMDLQRSFPLGYSFSGAFLYSYELFEDLSTLEFEGEISELVYRHDGFLPKSFVELSATGLLRGQQILTEFSEEDKMVLENAVAKGVQHYYHTWRLWSRPEPLVNDVPDKSSYTR